MGQGEPQPAPRGLVQGVQAHHVGHGQKHEDHTRGGRQKQSKSQAAVVGGIPDTGRNARIVVTRVGGARVQAQRGQALLEIALAEHPGGHGDGQEFPIDVTCLAIMKKRVVLARKVDEISRRLTKVKVKVWPSQ